MPKQVDHEGRRDVLAEAVWRLLRHDGLEAVTMRQVATEAEVSLGQVQYYFTGKDELVRFALDRVSAQVEARLADRRLESSNHEPRAAVLTLLLEMLPLDEQRRTEAHVAFAYFARAAVSTPLAAPLRDHYAGLESFVAAQIERAQQDETAGTEREPNEEAAVLLALVDGLSAHVLVGARSPADARRALEAHVDALFGPAQRSR